MKTIELLNELYEKIESNPELCMRLDWMDLSAGIKEELSYYELFYPSSQYDNLILYIEALFQQMLEATNTFEIPALLANLKGVISSLTFLPDLDETEKKIFQANLDHALSRYYKEHTTLVVGDSHVNFFSGNEKLTFEPIGMDFNICPQRNHLDYTVFHLGPCLAYTSRKYDSTYHFREKLELLHEKHFLPGSKIILSLGEIDLRVHVYPQMIKRDCQYTEVVDDILQNYEKTILWLVENGYQVCIWGPIASQPDSAPYDSRFPRNGSEIFRNEATKYFNDTLSKWCKQNEISFMTIFYDMITPDFHTKVEYLSADVCHLGQKAMEIFPDKPLF